MLRKWMMFFGIGLLVWTQGIEATQVVRRFVLAVGANFGGSERTPLRYAVSDAEHFAQVLEMMGGVNSEDQFLLYEPSTGDFKQALTNLKTQVAEASQSSARIEVVLYYSGPADENGLLLGRTRFAYKDLRQAMRDIPADVQIAVLDACASGAITRFKGGSRQQPFLVDASSDMKGHAFLTSSSENEVAQESDTIGASFFTHYLVSGLRGAADISGDGKVTLNEAYQFAFQNTLDRTVDTQGGAQHPAYDINMTGTGDVVITDLRQTSAGLILGESLSGRFYIRDSDRRLVAELNKPLGREVEIGLPPGTYYVHLEQRQAFTTSALEITDQQRQMLKPDDFHRATQLETVSRGGDTDGVEFELNEPLDGEAIGLVSYANNGLLNLNVSQDEVGMSHLTLQSGSRHLYTAYSVGAKAFDGHSVFALGIGFGGQIDYGRAYLDFNGHQYMVFEDVDTSDPHNHLSRLRGSFGIKLTNNISGFVGASANFLWNGKHRLLLSPWGGHKDVSKNGKYTTWPGYFVGLQIGRPSR